MIASGEIDDRLLAVAAVFDDLFDDRQQAVISAFTESSIPSAKMRSRHAAMNSCGIALARTCAWSDKQVLFIIPVCACSV